MQKISSFILLSVFVFAQGPLEVLPISQSLKQNYLKAINDARTQRQHCGRYGIRSAAAPVKWSDELYRAALEHSMDMAANNIFSHSGSGKKTDCTGRALGKQSKPRDRIIHNGYKAYGSIGENIAGGTHLDHAAKTVQIWLKSPKHCAILMDPTHKKTGMAMSYSRESNYAYYWTQVFSDR